MMQAACGRWLCETQTLMKADKRHKPVGGKKHWAGNHKLHSSLHGYGPTQTSTLKTSLLLALLATKGSGQLKGRFKEDSKEKT